MAGLETDIVGDRPVVRCWGYGVYALCAYFGCRYNAPFYFFCRARQFGTAIERHPAGSSHADHRQGEWKQISMSLTKFSQMNPDILAYVMSLLRDDAPLPPKALPDDWQKAMHLCGSHTIVPLLFWKIQHTPPHTRPPEKVFKPLRHTFLLGIKQSMLMEKQILEIAHTFDRDGIAYRILKGPGLAWTVYPDPALRLSGDLDILVLPHQFIQARNALEQIGYVCRARNFEHCKWFAKDETFFRKGYSGIELHFDILGWSRLRKNWNVEEFFQRSTIFSLSGYPVHALSDTDAFVHSILHVFVGHQRAERLIWIYDIALLADKLTASGGWPLLLEQSRKRNILLAVEYGMKITQQWTHFRIPEECQDYFRRQKPTESEKRDWKIALNIKSGILNKLRMYWTEETGLLDKLLITLQLTFPTPEHLNDFFRPSRKVMLPLSYFRRILNHFK